MTFSEKQEQREFVVSRPTLQEILKKVLQTEVKFPSWKKELQKERNKRPEKGQIVCVNIREY